MIGRRELQKLGTRMINACRRLHERGILFGVGGNISLRSGNPDIILCSPSGIPLMEMRLADICAVDITEIEKGKYEIKTGRHDPTSEIRLHGGIYRARPEINAVIHTHPPMVTAFSCTSVDVDFNIQEDQQWYIGEVDFLPFKRMEPIEFAKAAVSKLARNYALVLKNHGLVALGDTLSEAVNITETLEGLARTYYYAKNIDGGNIVRLPYENGSRSVPAQRMKLLYDDGIFDE
jgi:L-fuculose-phosphate aldolase